MAGSFDPYDMHGYSSYHAGAPATGASSCMFYRECFSNNRTVVVVVILTVIARDSIYAKRAYAIAIPSIHLSVRLSVCHTGDSCKNGCS